MSNKRATILIIDGYPLASRRDLDIAGMKQAWKLFADMAAGYLPRCECRVWFPSDEPLAPGGFGPAHYDAVIWTGCNLTIYHKDDARVTRQIEFAKEAYRVGTPSFGSCWGIQMATLAAGGQVKANPRGREMCLARNIYLTDAGQKHPMMLGKPPVYSAFISHLDEVVRLPKGASLLACNDFTQVQALAVTHGKGMFWATQYHTEYELRDMARLIVARESKLVPEGFFTGHDDLAQYVGKLEALAHEPARKDLRWQLAVGDDVL
ncbi:MAG: gamma-glutamyl-gamma-aminobutyrate hydrolase family protein, partial [Elusimicrobiota bacterium]